MCIVLDDKRETVCVGIVAVVIELLDYTISRRVHLRCNVIGCTPNLDVV
jgi:hypothetical protein